MKRRHVLPLSLTCALGLATLAAGCRKRQPAPPAEATGTAVASPVEAPSAAAPSAAAASPTGNVPGAVDLAPVQQAVDRFWKERKHTPYTLQDLVRAGYLRALPTPPPGKQLHYDNERATVSLVDR